MLSGLKNYRFRNEIAQTLERNPIDGKTEIGGFIGYDFGNERPTITLSRNISIEERSMTWNVEDIATNPHISLFHLHAMYDDCSIYAGPSLIGEDHNRGKSDLNLSEEIARNDGESHMAIITRLPKKRFNVDYIGTQIIPHELTGSAFQRLQTTILDLGVYS